MTVRRHISNFTLGTAIPPQDVITLRDKLPRLTDSEKATKLNDSIVLAPFKVETKPICSLPLCISVTEIEKPLIPGIRD